MLKLKMSPRKRQKRLRSSSSSSPPSPSSLSFSSDERTHGSEESSALMDAGRERLADNIKALLHQEESKHYACTDYLSMTAWQHNVHQLMGINNKRPHTATETCRIDMYCRNQITEWTFRVVDYFRIDREVVSVSLSYLDRFLCTCSCDRSMFKLAATTTLYMAVKVFHPQKLEDLGVLSDLSRGEFDMADVSCMEEHILRALNWRLHPPTAVAMGSLLLDYVFMHEHLRVSEDYINEIHDNVSFFGELAVCDYFFVTLRPSTVAFAAILNSVEGVLCHDDEVTALILKATTTLHFTCDRQELSAARNRLWELYERSEECALHMENCVQAQESPTYTTIKKTSSMQTLSTSSPVSVNLPIKTYSKTTLRNGSW